MMIGIASLVLLLLIALSMGPLLGDVGEKFAFGDAYSLTQRIVSVINILSASPQNETAIIELNPLTCNITFYRDFNYIESYVKFMGESRYGQHIFGNINLDLTSLGSDTIECDSKNMKKIFLEKTGNTIKVSLL